MSFKMSLNVAQKSTEILISDPKLGVNKTINFGHILAGPKMYAVSRITLKAQDCHILDPTYFSRESTRVLLMCNAQVRPSTHTLWHNQ